MKQDPGIIDIQNVETATRAYWLVGSSPLIFNSMAAKAKRELLLPSGRKTAATKASSLKHDPMQEFRNSVNRLKEDEHPDVYLGIPSTAFKSALGTAALDLPNAKKAQIGRLVWVHGDYVPVYGVPSLLMSVVRMADINRTPDVRTRAILRTWACRVVVSYVSPLLNDTSLANLLLAAGFTCGVGDFRQEKGAGSYGLFTPVMEDDPRLAPLLAEGGRAAQVAALASPEFYDEESKDLYEWYEVEVRRRGLQVAS